MTTTIADAPPAPPVVAAPVQDDPGVLALVKAYKNIQEIRALKLGVDYITLERSWGDLSNQFCELNNALSRKRLPQATTSRTLALRHVRTMRNQLETIERLEAERARPSGIADPLSLVPDLNYEYFAAEVSAMKKVFPDAGYNPNYGCLCVTTAPIILEIPAQDSRPKEDVDLGPFNLLLDHNALANGLTTSEVFVISAKTPKYSMKDSHFFHPHVNSNGKLCAGEAAAAINACLGNGRVQEAFMVVHSVLNTYNPSSPYQPLRSWVSMECRNCGGYASGPHILHCSACGGHYCDKCAGKCKHCGRQACRNCIASSTTNPTTGTLDVECARCVIRCVRCEHTLKIEDKVTCGQCSNHGCVACMGVITCKCTYTYCKKCRLSNPDLCDEDGKGCTSCRPKAKCPTCARLVDTRKIVECACGKAKGCFQCQRQCAGCKKGTCPTCQVYSETTGSYYCRECAKLTPCDCCQNEKLAADLADCTFCKEKVCRKCSRKVCSFCNKEGCDSCVKRFGSSRYYYCRACKNAALCEACQYPFQAEGDAKADKGACPLCKAECAIRRVPSGTHKKAKAKSGGTDTPAVSSRPVR